MYHDFVTISQGSLKIKRKRWIRLEDGANLENLESWPRITVED